MFPFRKTMMWIAGGGVTLVVMIIFAIAWLVVHVDRKPPFPSDAQGLYDLHKDQCESPRSAGLFAEPENTWSNFAYFLAGVLVFLRARTSIGRISGLNLVLLAIMSGWYHASLSHDLAQRLDVAGIYAVLFSVILMGGNVTIRSGKPWLIGWWWLGVGVVQAAAFLAAVALTDFAHALVPFVALSVFIIPGFAVLAFLTRKALKSPLLSWIWWGTVIIVLGLFGYLIRAKLGWDSDAVFPIFIGNLAASLIVLIANAQRDDPASDVFQAKIFEPLNWWIMELVVLVVVAGGAFFVRLCDGYSAPGVLKPLCSPGSVIQAHAVCHVLSALALLLTYDLITQFNQSSVTGDKPAVFPNLNQLDDASQ